MVNLKRNNANGKVQLSSEHHIYGNIVNKLGDHLINYI